VNPPVPGRRCCLQLGMAAALGTCLAREAVAQSAAPAAVLDETWIDSTRQRAVPVRIRWPALPGDAAPLAMVLFSHGLGGTVEGGTLWSEAWAEAGFVVVHLQHPGSDFPAVRASASSFSDRAGLRSAATAQQLLARVRDVGFVLDQIGQRQSARQGRWAGVRVDRIGMSGHSFGAQTTLALAGQAYPGFGGITEPRLASFIALSPSLPVSGDPQAAFARMVRPLLAVTGTRDQDMVGTGATPERRMAVFGALPAGDKGQLVLQDADHMTFAGQTGRAVEIQPREAITRSLQASHHALVAAITTDWWRATLRDDAAARARLAQPAGLAPGDTWQRK